MDLPLLLWIAFWGLIPPAITSAIVGYVLFLWGKKQGERSYLMAKEEIKAYVRTELVTDLRVGITEEIRNGINGIFGPVAKAGTAEGRAIAAQYAQSNPGIASLLTGVAAKGAARWLGKQLGVPRDVVDVLGGGAPSFQLGHKRTDPALEPVVIPGGGPR